MVWTALRGATRLIYSGPWTGTGYAPIAARDERLSRLITSHKWHLKSTT